MFCPSSASPSRRDSSSGFSSQQLFKKGAPGLGSPTFQKREAGAVQFLVGEMDGLALGIQQMAALIKHQELTNNIAKFVEKYKRRLPGMLKNARGVKGHTLATLWKMTFEDIRLRRNVWTMFGIISCLQPDEIPTQLFLPDESVPLTSDLEFCREEFE